MDSLITPFNYEHFKARREIRLLRLHPAPFLSSDLHGEIFHAKLHSDMIPYDALSYTWGDNQQTYQLFIDGNKLAITSNLDSALRRLRFKQDSRVIWVDAICINQKDVPEKNVQVPLMREIYEFASKTVVWFGEVEDAQIGLDFLDELRDKLYEPWKGFDPWAAGKLHSGSDGFTSLGERPYSEPCWKWFSETIAYEFGVKDDSEAIAVALDYKRKWDAVANLFEKPWWERIWVIQEVAHVGIVRAYIGSIDMSFDALIENYTRFDRLKKRQVALKMIDRKAQRAETATTVPILRSLKELLQDCGSTTDSLELQNKIQNVQEIRSILVEVHSAVEQQRELDHLTERLKALKTERAAIVAIHSLRRDAVILGEIEMPKVSRDILAVFRDATPVQREQTLRTYAEDKSEGIQKLIPILRQYSKRLREGRIEIAEREAQAALAGMLHFDFRVSRAGDRYAVPHSDLLQNIWDFRDQGATDWRDKVYALLGMSQDFLDIDVDYSADVTSSDVFQGATRGLIEKSRKLDVLTGVGGEGKADTTSWIFQLGTPLPSWVFDLRTPATYHSRVMFSMRKSFTATKGSSIFDYKQIPAYDQPERLWDSDIFFLKGKSIGVVTEVFDSKLEIDAEHNSDNIALFHYTSPFTEVPTENTTPLVTTPFNTSWGPGGINPGDEIVLLMGGSVPFVLRQDNDGLEGFSLIGACLLIDGELVDRKGLLDGKKDPGYSEIMYGSAWEDDEPQDELFDFMLR